MNRKSDKPETNLNTSNSASASAKYIEWDACSFGSTGDLLVEQETKLNINLLGFDLPINDKTKAGNLDNISADSFWIGEEEIVGKKEKIHDKKKEEKHFNSQSSTLNQTNKIKRPTKK